MFPYQPFIVFNPLQYRNKTGSQPYERMHLDELLVSKMLVTHKSIYNRSCRVRYTILPVSVYYKTK